MSHYTSHYALMCNSEDEPDLTLGEAAGCFNAGFIQIDFTPLKHL